MSLLQYRPIIKQLSTQRLLSTWILPRTYPISIINHLQRRSLSKKTDLRRQQQQQQQLLSSPKADDPEMLAMVHKSQKVLSFLSSIDPFCCCQCKRTAAAVEGSDSHSIAVEPSLNSDDRDCDDIKQDERVLCAKGGGEEEEEEGGGGIGGGHGKCMKELRFLLEITEVFQVIRQCILQRSADRINRTRIETEEAITSRFYANEIKPKNPIEALARNTELVAQVKESKKEIEDSRGEIHREEEAAVLAEYGLSATEYAQLGAFRYERNVRAHPVVGSLDIARVLGLWRRMQKKAGR